MPDASIQMLFCDTFLESDGCYRMLIEGAANIAGVPTPGESFADFWRIPELDLEDFEPRRKHLQAMARHCNQTIPGLNWIASGKHPWEIFEEERFIGNARVDPCSKILKRKLMDTWRANRFTPETCVVCVGILWDEAHRIDQLQTRAAPWQFIAPLVCKPWISKNECLEWARAEGLSTSESYDEGFSHDNCGGWCCKAGHGHYANLLEKRPKIYLQHERREKKTMVKLGSRWGILRDRRGGAAKPLTMEQFRIRHEQNDITPEERHDLGGCACAFE